MLVAEWGQRLGTYPVEDINRALDAVAKSNTAFAPNLPQFLDLIRGNRRAERKTWRKLPKPPKDTRPAVEVFRQMHKANREALLRIHMQPRDNRETTAEWAERHRQYLRTHHSEIVRKMAKQVGA